MIQQCEKDKSTSSSTSSSNRIEKAFQREAIRASQRRPKDFDFSRLNQRRAISPNEALARIIAAAPPPPPLPSSRPPSRPPSCISHRSEDHQQQQLGVADEPKMLQR